MASAPLVEESMTEELSGCRCVVVAGRGSEVRQFILSGFAERLKRRCGTRLRFSVRVPDWEDERWARSQWVEVVEWMGAPAQAKVSSFWVSRVADLLHLWKNRTSRMSYSRPAGGVSPSGGRAAVAARALRLIPGAASVIRRLEEYAGQIAAKRSGVLARLEKGAPDVVVVNTPRSTLYREIQFACRLLDIPIVCVYHTWKDLDVNPRLSFPVDLHLTWNEEMCARIVEENPWVSPGQVVSCGSLYHDRERLSKRIIQRDEFIGSLGFDRGARYVLYTAADPRAAPGEAEFVKQLIVSLKESRVSPPPKMIIRLNPMDADRRLTETAGESVRVIPPDWTWNPERNWNAGTDSDLTLYTNLLAHAECTLGIPSTTAIDSLLHGTRVVNVTGECTGDPRDGAARSIWNAPFYRPLREANVVKLTTTPKRAVGTMFEEIGKGKLTNTEIAAGIGPIVGSELGGAVDRSVSHILNLVRRSQFAPSAGT